jgi:hypothetical protein
MASNYSFTREALSNNKTKENLRTYLIFQLKTNSIKITSPRLVPLYVPQWNENYLIIVSNMRSIVYIVRNVYVQLINTVKFETDAVTRVHSHICLSNI